MPQNSELPSNGGPLPVFALSYLAGTAFRGMMWERAWIGAHVGLNVLLHGMSAVGYMLEFKCIDISWVFNIQ
jgi:hypothetical protein